MPFLLICVFGFSVFSMFFGSGNLVFPLKVGIVSGTAWPYGLIGLFLSGIILPFLGLMAVKLKRGSVEDFFYDLGPGLRTIIPFFLISLLGSFGVVPRCITVAHGGLEKLFPTLRLDIFSALFCIASFALCVKPRHMIHILGRYLTPLLLGFLGLLTLKVLKVSPSVISHELTSVSALHQGFLRGYEPMDLLAAFFFSAFIFKEIENKTKGLSEKKRLLYAALTSLLGVGLLALVYGLFVYMGAAFASMLHQVSPELLLPTIAYEVMGPDAALVMAVIILLSCLTTAVALSGIYAGHIQNCVPQKIAYPYALILTLGISFILSLWDFNGIMAFLGPILDVLYPGLIVYTCFSLKISSRSSLKKWSFIGMVVLSILLHYVI